jgi:hypothetical protein
MKKKINSKNKGNRAELELSKILTQRFGEPFARVGVSSGARPKQVKLDGHATETFTGDLIVPEGFKFSVECKAVNVDVDFLAESALLDKFLHQATDDAKSIGKLPLLCWKRNRKGWIAALPANVFANSSTAYPLYCVLYRCWAIVKLESLLHIMGARFWYEQENT